MNAPTLTTITKTEARAANGMVATKDVHATMAGVSMLENGGNAVDAAVAACFAIGVVEPAIQRNRRRWLSGLSGRRPGRCRIGFPMKGPLAVTPDMYELTGEAAVGNFGWAGVVNDENLEGYRLDRRAGRGRRTVRSAQTPWKAAACRSTSLPRSRSPGTATLPAGTTSTPSV